MSCLINLNKYSENMNVEFPGHVDYCKLSFGITTNVSFGDTLLSICCQGVHQCKDLSLDQEARTYKFNVIKEITHEQSTEDQKCSTDDASNLSSSKSDPSAFVTDTERFSGKKVIDLDYEQQSVDDNGSYDEAYKTSSNKSWRILHAGDISPVLFHTVGSEVKKTQPQNTFEEKHQGNTTMYHSLPNITTRTNERKRRSAKDTDNHISNKRRLEEVTHVKAISYDVLKNPHAPRHHRGTREMEIPQESTASCDVAEHTRLLASEQTQENTSKMLEEFGLEIQPDAFYEARNVKIETHICDGFKPQGDGDRLSTNTTKEYDFSEEKETLESNYSDTYRNSDLQNDLALSSSSESDSDQENNDENYSNPYWHSQELEDSCGKKLLFGGDRVDYPEEDFRCPGVTKPNENQESNNDIDSDSCSESDSSFYSDENASFEVVRDPDLFPVKIAPIKRKNRALPSLRITLLTYRTLRKACQDFMTCCEEYCWIDWPTASLIRAMSEFR